MINKYIKDIVQKNGRVIVPNIGSIVWKSEENIFTFNSILRFNDGVLIKYIVEVENIEIEAAKKLVDDYVQSIIDNLKSGDEFAIPNLGSFFMDNNKISFKNSGTFAHETSKKTPADSVASKNVDQDSKQAKGSREISEAKINVNSQLSVDNSTNSENSKATTSEKPPIIEESKTNTNTSSKKVGLKPPVQRKTNNTSTRKRGLLFYIIGIGLLLFLALFFIFIIKYKDNFSSEKITVNIVNEKKTVKTNQSDTTKNVNTSNHTSLTNQKIDTVNVETTETMVYFTIAGCFKDEENANKMVKILLSKGYKDAARIGLVKGLHAVSFSAFKTKEEAEVAARIIEQKGLTTWIYSIETSIK